MRVELEGEAHKGNHSKLWATRLRTGYCLFEKMLVAGLDVFASWTSFGTETCPLECVCRVQVGCSVFRCYHFLVFQNGIRVC